MIFVFVSFFMEIYFHEIFFYFFVYLIFILVQLIDFDLLYSLILIKCGVKIIKFI